MSLPRGKKLLIFAIVLVIFGLVLWIARLYVLSQIKVKLEEQLFALRDSGYLVKYDSISVNTSKNEVEVHRLVIKRDFDSTSCAAEDFFSSSYIKAEGFKFIPLLLKRKLSFESITIDSPRVVMNQKFFTKKPTNGSQGQEFSISIKKLKLPHLRFSILDSATCDRNVTVTLNSFIEDFALSFYKDRKPFYNITSFYSDSLKIDLPKEYYKIQVTEVRLNLALGIFDLDTMRIMPQLGKIAFGRQKEKQVDRIEALIPYINLYGLDIYKEDSLSVSVKKMTTQLFLKVFRDKRQPFHNPYKPLPAEALARLAFGLKIDSLMVNKTYIEYEEFAEHADSAGRIFFDDVFACIKNIDNGIAGNGGEIQMKATAKLSGQGDLYVTATVPHNMKAKTSVRGSLKDFDFAKLNPILEPQARMRAESGHLHEMDFQFAYDNNHSRGTVDLKYNNLKLVSFRSNEQIDKKLEKRKKRKGHRSDDDENIEKAPLKTFVLNAFILKKNVDDNVIENRAGKISFDRDKRRSLFNYWAKSLLSGLKSAYNIDKIEDSRLNKILAKKDKN